MIQFFQVKSIDTCSSVTIASHATRRAMGVAQLTDLASASFLFCSSWVDSLASEITCCAALRASDTIFSASSCSMAAQFSIGHPTWYRVVDVEWITAEYSGLAWTSMEGCIVP